MAQLVTTSKNVKDLAEELRSGGGFCLWAVGSNFTGTLAPEQALFAGTSLRSDNPRLLLLTWRRTYDLTRCSVWSRMHHAAKLVWNCSTPINVSTGTPAFTFDETRFIKAKFGKIISRCQTSWEVAGAVLNFHGWMVWAEKFSKIHSHFNFCHQFTLVCSLSVCLTPPHLLHNLLICYIM